MQSCGGDGEKWRLSVAREEEVGDRPWCWAKADRFDVWIAALSALRRAGFLAVMEAPRLVCAWSPQ